MWTVTTLVVITVWMTWHVCWCARSSSFICSCCHVHLSSWLFVCFCCLLWVATSLMAMWLLFLVWKRSGAGGVMVLTSTLSVVCIHHVLLLLVHCWLPCRCFWCGPCFSSEKMRGGAHLKLWGQWQRQASSPSGWRGMSVDMPGRRHELSCFIQLVTWQHCVVVVVSMHGGGGWQSNSGCRRWWWKETVCLLMSCICCSQQTPLTWLLYKIDRHVFGKCC